MTRTIVATAVAGAALALASAGAWADATASASLTQLTFTLVNLDPSDGITPSIQFSAGSNGSVTTTAGTAASSTAKDSQTGADGFGSVQGSSASTTFAGSSAAVSSTGSSLSVSSSAFADAAGGSWATSLASAGSNGGFTTFVLSPETELIVTATATMSATSSATSALEYGESLAELSLGTANSFPQFAIDGADAGLFMFGTTSDSLTETFELDLDNTTTSAETGTFLAATASFVYSGLPAVPEPAEGGLLVAGLGVLALARRRLRTR